MVDDMVCREEEEVHDVLYILVGGVVVHIV